MADYWQARQRDALRKALAAPTQDIRDIHLRTAEHYRSLAIRSATAHLAATTRWVA